MQEIWKPIVGWEGLYEVSNLGNIRSLDKYVNSGIKNNTKVLRKGQLLKTRINQGYLEVTLTHNNKRKYCKVHRLVAQAFIPNPDNLPQINHKDENPLNNNAGNLEWCTAQYNCSYGNRNKNIYKNTRSISIAINQYDLNNNLIRTYKSIAEASKSVNKSTYSIRRYCDGITNDKNYIWKYAKK